MKWEIERESEGEDEMRIQYSTDKLLNTIEMVWKMFFSKRILLMNESWLVLL